MLHLLQLDKYTVDKVLVVKRLIIELSIMIILEEYQGNHHSL